MWPLEERGPQSPAQAPGCARRCAVRDGSQTARREEPSRPQQAPPEDVRHRAWIPVAQGVRCPSPGSRSRETGERTDHPALNRCCDGEQSEGGCPEECPVLGSHVKTVAQPRRARSTRLRRCSVHATRPERRCPAWQASRDDALFRSPRGLTPKLLPPSRVRRRTPGGPPQRHPGSSPDSSPTGRQMACSSESVPRSAVFASVRRERAARQDHDLFGPRVDTRAHRVSHVSVSSSSSERESVQSSPSRSRSLRRT